mgnify:CR=1 FL=1
MISGFIIMALPFISIISAIAYLPYALYITKRLGRQTFLYHIVRFVFIGYLMSLIYLKHGASIDNLAIFIAIYSLTVIVS